MKQGKLIVIAGTDCSGKQTQTKLLNQKLDSLGIPNQTMSFPRYNTPTGRIVGGPYLGKPEICPSWFPNGANSVDPKIASLFYAADRGAALPEIREILESKNLVLDRYVSANMGHQGGKIRDPKKREEFYQWLDQLEYGSLELPRPDATIFLYMPFKVAMKLKKSRQGDADQHESNPDHLKNAEEAYLQLANFYNWTQINCITKKDKLKSPEEIHNGVWGKLRGLLGF